MKNSDTTMYLAIDRIDLLVSLLIMAWLSQKFREFFFNRNVFSEASKLIYFRNHD